MRKITFLLLCVFAVAACQRGNETVVDNNENVVVVDENYSGVNGVVATDDGNGLKIETDKHVIKIDGAPGKKYQYRVWSGTTDTETSDPDVIVDDGQVMVRSAD